MKIQNFCWRSLHRQEAPLAGQSTEYSLSCSAGLWLSPFVILQHPEDNPQWYLGLLCHPGCFCLCYIFFRVITLQLHFHRVICVIYVKKERKIKVCSLNDLSRTRANNDSNVKLKHARKYFCVQATGAIPEAGNSGSQTLAFHISKNNLKNIHSPMSSGCRGNCQHSCI